MARAGFRHIGWNLSGVTSRSSPPISAPTPMVGGGGFPQPLLPGMPQLATVSSAKATSGLLTPGRSAFRLFPDRSPGLPGNGLERPSVYLDFRRNQGPALAFPSPGELVCLYDLKKTGLSETFLVCLACRDPGLSQQCIDLGNPEIAVCAQHHNRAEGNIWWSRTSAISSHRRSLRHHGVYRPGGGLNAGQVGGYRAAQYIANCYPEVTMDPDAFPGKYGKRSPRN